MSINRAILVGRLTKDPELRYTPNGIAVCNFTIAVNRTFKQDGQQQADFIQIQVWRKQAEDAATYLKKVALLGSMAVYKPAVLKDKMAKRYLLQKWLPIAYSF